MGLTRHLLALAVLALGCGETATINVELNYLGDCDCDYFDVDLSGGATAALLFYLDEDTQADRGGCSDLAPSADNDLDDIAALLTSTSIEPIRTDRVLYVAAMVYSPPIASASCGAEEVDDRIILYGEDDDIPLSGGNTTIFLDMSCESLPPSLCL